MKDPAGLIGSVLDRSTLGEALVRLRGSRSQRTVARQAGVPNGTWCMWERGNRTPREYQIQRVLLGLDCTLDELRLEVWRVQGERFRAQGSEFGAELYGEKSLFQRADEIVRLDLSRVPEAVRPTLRRMRDILGALCTQVEPLLSEYEALFFNLTRLDAARPDAARPDAARPDAARPDAARPDAARPDAAPALASHSETSQEPT